MFLGLFRFLWIKIGIAQGALVIQRPNDGMKLDDKEYAAWFQECGDDLRPPAQIRQPTNDSIRSKHNIKLFMKKVRRIVEVCTNKARWNRQLGAEAASNLDSARGEINASDLRSESRP